MSDNKLITGVEGVFGGTYRHPCIAGLNGNGCTNVMVVPDPNTEGAPQVLMEGQIWTCVQCGANHEYYIIMKAGGVREGCVRLLQGENNRESSEPTLTEWME